MSELSPAAQAVLDAFGNASDGEYVDGVWVVNERTMIAAALRTLADTKASEVSVEGHCRTIVDVDDIYAIADELETQP